MPAFGPVLGKGDAMWRALSVARGDIVMYARRRHRQTSGATSSTGCSARSSPSPSVRFVKATYHRPFTAPDGDGGWTTPAASRS